MCLPSALIGRQVEPSGHLLRAGASNRSQLHLRYQLSAGQLQLRPLDSDTPRLSYATNLLLTFHFV